MAIDSSNELFYAYKAIKLLTKPFTEWPAYKEGIIDDHGERIISHWSTLEKDEYDTYNIFIRFMAIVKQHLEHVPMQKKLHFKKRLILKKLREHLEKSSSADETIDFLIELKSSVEERAGHDLNEAISEAIFSTKSYGLNTFSELESLIEEIENFDLDESMTAGAGPVGIAGVNDAQSNPATDTIVPSRLNRKKKKKDEEETENEKAKKSKSNSFRKLIDKL